MYFRTHMFYRAKKLIFCLLGRSYNHIVRLYMDVLFEWPKRNNKSVRIKFPIQTNVEYSNHVEYERSKGKELHKGSSSTYSLTKGYYNYEEFFTRYEDSKKYLHCDTGRGRFHFVLVYDANDTVGNTHKVLAFWT